MFKLKNYLIIWYVFYSIGYILNTSIISWYNKFPAPNVFFISLLIPVLLIYRYQMDFGTDLARTH